MAKIWQVEPTLLLHPNIPQPLHGLAPRVVLGSSWWNVVRKQAYESTNFRCKACAVHKSKALFRQWLEGHEIYDIDYSAGTATYVRTVPLCHLCHNFIHDGRLESLLQAGKITARKYTAVIQHGQRVLAQAGLTKPTKADRDAKVLQGIIQGTVAPWNKWRMIVENKSYPSLFKDLAEYATYHSRKNAEL